MRVVVAVLLCLLAAAPAADADTIVYRRGTDVWRMAPDGSGQAALTHGERRYEWPSAADDGTIVASDETGQLWRLSRDGAATGGPIPTAATVATQDVPAETPTHVRISPDATTIAYDEEIESDATTLWTPAAATGLDFPGQEDGQLGLVAPSWIGNGTLLLSRDTASDDPGATFSLYGIGGADGTADPWFSDDAATWATGFDAAASRSGTRIAVLEDDAANNDGTPTRVVLRLFVAGAPDAPPAFRCELGLQAEDTYSSASPTFSPDGTRLAWAQSDGIHVANLGALDDCGAIRQRVVTLPGAWEPYWTPASLPAPVAGVPGAAKLTLAVRTRARPHRATLRKHGLRVRITASAPAAVRVSVRVAGKKRYAGHATARIEAGTTTVTVRLRSRVLRSAKRLIVRVSAPGAKPAEANVKPKGARPR
jgi:WD40 repeat protein